MNARDFYLQVHHLAYHYHWAERDILELSKTKRQRYIDLISQQMNYHGE